MHFAKNFFIFVALSLIFSVAIFSVPTFADDKTSIPKIFITGDISDMNNKNDKRKVFLKYENDGKIIERYVKMKLQGSTSLRFEKKNYTINLFKDDKYNDRYGADFGWGEHDEYALKANWPDKTYARNIVTANLAAEINEKYGFFTSAPNYGEIDGYPVEVYVNDDFFGLYTLNIPKSSWMLDMDEDNTRNILFSNELDENFLEQENKFDGAYDLEVGNDEGYAVSQLNKMLDFIKNSSDEDFRQGIGNYFELDNLLNYYAFVEFAELSDNISKNILFATYDGNKWFLVLYDLDLSWGTWFERILDYRAFSGIEKNILFKRLRENFPNELANRYFALRKTILTKENVLNKFYEFESKIPQSSIEKDKAKWGEPLGRDISQIEEFLDARIPTTDEFFYNMYTTSPQVYLRRETDKNNEFVKTVLVTNREDIILDGEERDSLEFTFYRNGTHEISCHDWFGNYAESFKIEIDSIKKEETWPTKLAPITTISSLFCFIIIFFISKRLVYSKALDT